MCNYYKLQFKKKIIENHDVPLSTIQASWRKLLTLATDTDTTTNSLLMIHPLTPSKFIHKKYKFDFMHNLIL